MFINKGLTLPPLILPYLTKYLPPLRIQAPLWDHMHAFVGSLVSENPKWCKLGIANSEGMKGGGEGVAGKNNKSIPAISVPIFIGGHFLTRSQGLKSYILSCLSSTLLTRMYILNASPLSAWCAPPRQILGKGTHIQDGRQSA